MAPRDEKAEAAKAREDLRYNLTEDITQWLRNNSVSAPMLYPTWPRAPGYYPVFLQWCEGQSPILGVAVNAQEMRAFTHPQRLWFHLPKEILIEATSVEPTWFA